MVSAGLEAELLDLARETQELASRWGRLYGSLQGWVGPPAGDQASQSNFLTETLATLSAEWDALEARLPG